MLFAFSLSILGSAFAFRIFHLLISRDLFTKRELTKIGTACSISQLFMLLLLPRTHVDVWISIFLPLSTFMIALFAMVRSRMKTFKAAIREVLTLVSLKMKGGRSFRQSFTEVSAESDPRLRAKLTEIHGAVVFSQQSADLKTDLFISELIEELIRIDQQPHLAARRLNVYRDRLRIESDFRRKSGQVLARIRAQSLIMTGLFVAMTVFVALKFGFERNLRFLVASTVFFLAGAVWIWRGGRKIKWKV